METKRKEGKGEGGVTLRNIIANGRTRDILRNENMTDEAKKRAFHYKQHTHVLDLGISLR